MRRRLEVQPVNVGSGGHISTKKNGSYVARRTRCQSHPAIASGYRQESSEGQAF